MKELSKRQEQIFNFIKSEVKLKGYPPSVREICVAVGLKSTSSVHAHLSTIETKGYIKRDLTKPRAIQILVHDEDEMFKTNVNMVNNTSIAMVPIIGKVSAGQPILAVENIEDTFPLPNNFVDDGDYFMLQITGNSMYEIGILDADYVLVKQQEDAKNGDIVIAMIDDSATCKTFYKEENCFRLQPENPTLDPIYTKELSIKGIVKGVYRKM